MRFLIVTPELPFPHYKDGSAHLLYYLIEEWRQLDINLDIVYYGPKDFEGEQECVERSINVYSKPIIQKRNLLNFLFHSLKIPRNSLDFRFESFNYQSKINYDLIICFRFSSGYLLKYIRDIFPESKLVFFEIDSLSLMYNRLNTATHNYVKKFYYLFQKNVVQRAERKFFNEADETVFVSSVDKEYVIRNNPTIGEEKFRNITLGIEESILSYNWEFTNKDFIDICFSGKLDYYPNKAAAVFIGEEILPVLIEKGFNFRLHIIGKNPPPTILHLQKKYQNHLIITGFVPDLYQYLSKMDIYISPLFSGAGMKNKILEAMAIGLPIICSPISADGITQIYHNGDVLITDSEKVQVWADQIIKLSEQDEQMKSMSKSCKKIIEDHYSWKKAAATFVALNQAIGPE